MVKQKWYYKIVIIVLMLSFVCLSFGSELFSYVGTEVDLAITRLEETKAQSKIDSEIQAMADHQRTLVTDVKNAYYYIHSDDNIIGDLDETTAKYSVYNDRVRQIDDLTLDSGIMNDNSSYSTSLYEGVNIAEEQFIDGYLSFGQYGDSYTLTTDFTKDTVTRYIDGEEKFRLVYNNVGRIEEKYIDGVLAETYEYNDNRQVTRVTDRITNFAYEIIWDGDVPSRVLQYIYRAGRYFMMKYNDFEPFTGRQDNAEYNHQNDGVSYLTSKTVDGYRYDYEYINNIVVSQTISSSNSEEHIEVDYLFDSALNRIGFVYNNEVFYYVYDLQGNVYSILSSTGEEVLHYTYDIVGNATISGSMPKLATINSFALRAKDNWIFDYTLQQYYEADNTYSARCGVDIVGDMFKQFAQDTVNKTIKQGALHTIKPSLEYVENKYDYIEDKIADLAGRALQKNSFDAYKKVLSIDGEIDELYDRLDIVAVPNSDDIMQTPMAFNIVNNDQNLSQEEIDKIEQKTYNTYYVNVGEEFYSPGFADFGVIGHFIIEGQYVKFYDKVNALGLLLYDVAPYEGEYDVELGNLYDYDNETYRYFDKDTLPSTEFTTVKSIYDKIDYDAILNDLNGQLDENPHLAKEVYAEDISVTYISAEYIQRLIENSREPLFVGGRTMDEMIRDFGEDFDLVYYDGKVELKENVPPEALYGTDWKEFAKDIAIGTGIILIGAAITVGTGGGGLVCFLTTAATMAGTSALTGAIGATVECAINDDWDSFAENFGEGYKISATVASVSSVAGAFAGVNVFPANCFTAGTPVVTANGFINIENIKTGDYVQSYNFDTNAVEEKRVVRTIENTTDTLVKVKVGSEIIETTLEHPFYVLGKGWMQAGDLVVGDLLIDNSGNTKEVTSKLICHLSDPVKIYNFEVEDNHNYYVGQNGVLVHNVCITQNLGATLTEAEKTRLAIKIARTTTAVAIKTAVGSERVQNGTIYNNYTFTIPKNYARWEVGIISKIMSKLLEHKLEKRIYFRVWTVNSYVVGVDLLRPLTYEEAKAELLSKKYSNFITWNEEDAVALITGAYNITTVVWHTFEFPELKINHYHPGKWQGNDIIKDDYLFDENKERSIHSFYLEGQENKEVK